MLLMYKKLNKRMNENQEILDKCLINLDVLEKVFHIPEDNNILIYFILKYFLEIIIFVLKKE